MHQLPASTDIISLVCISCNITQLPSSAVNICCQHLGCSRCQHHSAASTVPITALTSASAGWKTMCCPLVLPGLMRASLYQHANQATAQCARQPHNAHRTEKGARHAPFRRSAGPLFPLRQQVRDREQGSIQGRERCPPP